MAAKASERVKRYQNPNGPTISTVERKVIEQDGLYFKDIDGTGTVSAVNDWRLTPAERAEAYVKVLTTSEKIGQIFTSDWRMGPKYPSPRLAANGHKPVADESGLLDEAPVNVSDSIFGSQSLPSTSDMVKKSFNRHVILRESPTPEDLADYLNQLQYLTETCDHFVPMQVMSNSRNENGEVVATKADWAEASRVHRESVVLLKNDGTLPLKDGTKVYAEAFGKSAEAGEAATKALREMLGNVTLVDTPDEAQVALLMVSPQSGAYFNATPGYLELDICEDKTVCNVDESGKPTTETHKETTLVGANRLAGIAAAVHAHGGKVVSNINCPLAWEVGNVEKVSDALTVGFDTYPSATLDVMFGRFAPVGKLPLTLPKGDEVLAVNADGVCISPNDVPGFAKDAYMPDSMKDENGKAYAYRDAAGNYYEMNFGLTF